MKPQATTALITAAIVIVGVLLYATSLDYVPPYLIHDEAGGALQAHAIATTAHDLSGRLLPLYFTEPEFPPGRDPMMIYVTAIALRILPFTETGVRLPTVFVAVLNMALMFFAARALFRSTAAGVVAALLLMLSPVHFIRSRLMLSPVYSIPFILAWLWSLARFEEQASWRRFVQCCVWLGLGMYSYLAAVVMMPLYLVFTLAIAVRSLRWRAIALAAIVMAICLLPMGLWYVTHPERTSQIVSAYRLDSVGAAIAQYAHLYWSFFDPSYLFVSGDASLINTTRTAGLFPYAFAALIPIGLWALMQAGTAISWVIVAGFFASPIISVISGAIEMNRVMFAIPFAVLAATYGAMWLWQRSAIVPRSIATVMVLAVIIQFAAFHRDYMSERYRLASSTWYSGNVREAIRELIARADSSQVYISQDIEWVHRFWRFYAIGAGRLDLMSRTTYFKTAPEAAAGSKALCPEESPACSAMLASGAWRNVVSVPTIGGSRRFVILERTTASH